MYIKVRNFNSSVIKLSKWVNLTIIEYVKQSLRNSFYANIWKTMYDFCGRMPQGRKRPWPSRYFLKSNLNLPVRMHFAIEGFSFDQCYCNVRTLTKKFAYLTKYMVYLLLKYLVVTYRIKVPFVLCSKPLFFAAVLFQSTNAFFSTAFAIMFNHWRWPYSSIV